MPYWPLPHWSGELLCPFPGPSEASPLPAASEQASEQVASSHHLAPGNDHPGILLGQSRVAGKHVMEIKASLLPHGLKSMWKTLRRIYRVALFASYFSTSSGLKLLLVEVHC